MNLTQEREQNRHWRCLEIGSVKGVKRRRKLGWRLNEEGDCDGDQVSGEAGWE